MSTAAGGRAAHATPDRTTDAVGNHHRRRASDRGVLTALADKVLTPERLREMLRELKTRLKKSLAGQDDQVRGLQRELAELEVATNRLYEAVEKGLLPMDDMLTARAQKLKAKREAVLIEIAGAKRA